MNPGLMRTFMPYIFTTKGRFSAINTTENYETNLHLITRAILQTMTLGDLVLIATLILPMGTHIANPYATARIFRCNDSDH